MAAKSKNVIEPEQVVSLPPVTAQNEAKPARLHAFWKGFNPREPIELEDGTLLVFGTERYVTTDEVLADKISAVAKRYNILTVE